MVIITINGEIYKIKNLVNGKCYIGLTTVGIRRRFKEHCIAKSYIGSAIRKYGKDNFVISVIDYADNFNELQRKEIYYIDKYDTFKNGYNLTLGGEGNCTTPLLKVVLTDKMKKFRKYVEKENQKKIDVNDNNSMIKAILINLIDSYIMANDPRDKKKIAMLILSLKDVYISEILQLNLFNKEELEKWTI